jgi:iron complex transport system ATP-binding protein
MALIKVIGVEVNYKSVKALEDVTLDVSEGEIAAVLGPNGSGKTTLLRTIDGIVRPVRGSVYVDSKSVTRLTRREAARLIGYVPQHINISRGVKVIDFVLTGRRPHISFSPSDRDVDIALSYMSTLEIEHLATRDITELSGGELQRALIARALVAEPKVLLLDEPTSNLDLRYQVAILELVSELSRKKKITVMMALHDLTQAYRYSDKAILLSNGRIHAMGATHEALTPDTIKLVFGVEALVLSEHKAIIPAFYGR